MKQLNQVEIGRMRKLADFLETVPPEDFDLDGWVQQLPQGPKSIFFGLIHRHSGCGFAGCAMGWAAHSQIFSGLRLTRDGDDIAYRGFTGYDAVYALFGIGENQGFFLFSDRRYADDAEPGHVARRLRIFADKVERRLARTQAPGLRVVAASH